MEKIFFRKIKEGALFGTSFALTVGCFAIGYATYSSLVQVNSGDPLSYSAWNRMVTNLDDLNSRISAGMPSGTIIGYNGTACPSGWVEANGTSVPFAAGGTGSLDLRGSFIRGINGAANGRDVSRTVGNYQTDDFKSHTHGHDGYFASTYTVGDGDLDGSTVATGYDKTTIGGTIQNTGGSETRPKNVAVLFCVKQ